MPLVRKLDVDLWEVRVRLKDRIARVLFTIDASEAIRTGSDFESFLAEDGQLEATAAVHPPESGDRAEPDRLAGQSAHPQQ